MDVVVPPEVVHGPGRHPRCHRSRPLVEAHRPQNPARRAALEELNTWRNAIAHQDFPAALLRAGRPSLTLAQVQAWRRACDGLARSFDDVLRNHLQTLTGTLPW